MMLVPTSDGLAACCASFGEELAEAVGTVRLVVTRRELLSDQVGFAVRASETVSMVRLVSVQHTSCHDRLKTQKPHSLTGKRNEIRSAQQYRADFTIHLASIFLQQLFMLFLNASCTNIYLPGHRLCTWERKGR